MPGFRGLFPNFNVISFPVPPSTSLVYSWYIAYQSFFKTKKSKTETPTKRKYGVTVTEAKSHTSKIPLLVILGSNASALEDSDLFDVKDWTTISLPFKSSWLKSDKKVKRVSSYMIELVKELAMKDQAVIFYTFGEEGRVVYSQMTEALSTPGHAGFNAFEVAISIWNEAPKPSQKPIAPIDMMKSVLMRIKIPVAFGVLCQI